LRGVGGEALRTLSIQPFGSVDADVAVLGGLQASTSKQGLL
jgi:hypothetical protein